MKKIFLSLFSTSLLLFSSNFVYACNAVKKDQTETKRTEDTKKVVAQNYETYDQNFINKQIEQENKIIQDHLQKSEVSHVNIEKENLKTCQLSENECNSLNEQTVVDCKEKNDSVRQQILKPKDPIELLAQITWQFLENAQIRDLVAQIEENQIYQALIAKINSPVELIILDNNIVKNYSDHLQTKQYTVNLNYVIQNSLYPKIEKISFNCNVIVNQLNQRQINEQIANRYCDLIALWNKNSLHLYLEEWNENFNFYIVESLIKDIKTNAKIYALIDNHQIIDDLAIFIINNNQLVLESKDIIENQLYNVEIEVKVGQDIDQVIKWTSFVLDFRKSYIQKEEQIKLDLHNNIDQQDEYQSSSFESDLDSNNLDGLLNLTGITLDKIIDLLYNKPYFKDFITDLSLIITSSLITGI